MACRPGMPNVPGRTDQFFDPETGEIYPADPSTGQPDCGSPPAGNIQTGDRSGTTPSGVGIGGQLQALADALGVDISGLNEALGPSEFQRGLYDELQQYFQPQREALMPYLEGVNPAIESAIASAYAAGKDVDTGRLARSGTVRSGAADVLGERRRREATQQTAQARLATQQFGIQGLTQIGAQENAFLQALLGARSPLERVVAGVPGVPPFWNQGQGGGGGQTNIRFDFPTLQYPPEQQGGGGSQGGGGGGGGGNGTPPGCKKVYDDQGNWIWTDCSEQLGY